LVWEEAKENPMFRKHLVTLWLLIGCQSPVVEEDLPCSITHDCIDYDSDNATTGTYDNETDTEPDTAPDTSDDSQDQDTDPVTDPDPDTDTGTPCDTVVFRTSSGADVDMTQSFTDGSIVTLQEPGTLEFCPGTWYVDLTILSDVDVVGLGADRTKTILSGGYTQTVITVSSPGIASIENLTITHGTPQTLSDESAGGGLTCISNAEVSIENVTLTENQSYDGAGALAAHNCILYASDVAFTDNVAMDDAGGLMVYYAQAILEDVTFTDNTSRDGGAMFVYSSVLDIEGSAFENNSSSTYGGAILNYYSDIFIEDTLFAGNSSTLGGALANTGRIELENSQFASNTAQNGGAIYTYTSAHTEGEECQFSNNSPNDIETSSGADLNYADTVNFICDDDGCS